MLWKLRIGLFLLAASLTATVTAQSPAVFITPNRIEQSTQVERITNRSKSTTSTILEGDGQTLALEYSSNSDLEIFMFYLATDNSYDPADTVLFSLPAGENMRANVDLTRSAGWHPGAMRYKLTIMSASEDPVVGFAAADFTPTTLATHITIPAEQLFAVEVFSSSSYHALRGYKIYGIAWTTTFGWAIILIALTLCILRRKKNGVPLALGLLITGQLVYGLRFAIDELRITAEHLTSWYVDFMYDEGESIYQVAQSVKHESTRALTHIYVCRDGTDFKEKLLRYFAYPISISSGEAAATSATHFVVMNKKSWSYDDATHTLRCDMQEYKATLLQTFKDGSQLFAKDSLPPS